MCWKNLKYFIIFKFYHCACALEKRATVLIIIDCNKCVLPCLKWIFFLSVLFSILRGLFSIGYFVLWTIFPISLLNFYLRNEWMNETPRGASNLSEGECDDNSGIIGISFILITIVSEVVDPMTDVTIISIWLSSSHLTFSLSLSIVPLRILGCVLCKVDRAWVM